MKLLRGLVRSQERKKYYSTNTSKILNTYKLWIHFLEAILDGMDGSQSRWLTMAVQLLSSWIALMLLPLMAITNVFGVLTRSRRLFLSGKVTLFFNWILLGSSSFATRNFVNNIPIGRTRVISLFIVRSYYAGNSCFYGRFFVLKWKIEMKSLYKSQIFIDFEYNLCERNSI